MNAIVLSAPGRIEMRDVPTPAPGPGQVRIRTQACGICATDLVMIDGHPRVRPPAILGHEWSGVVEAVGPGVDAALAGRLCVAENVLADGGEVGFEHPGGYGEFLVTEAANVHALPDGYDPAAAALIEPLAVCVRAMRRLGDVGPGPLLILGDGPIGLLMLALVGRGSVGDATPRGAHPGLVLVGGRPGRLALARELGATAVLNYHDVRFDLAAGVMDQVCREGACPAVAGFAAVIEASGSATAMQAALDLAAPGGKVLIIGDYGDARADFPWNHLLHRELVLIGSNASTGAWPEAVRLATDPALPLARLVSARFPAAHFADAMALVRRRGEEVKVVLEW